MPINFQVLAYEPTPLGTLCLRRRELLSQPGVIVTEVTLNHEFLMSSLYTESERQLARIAVSLHGGHSLRVLVGGLGLGYTAQTAIDAEQVAHVDVMELLPQVIDWMERGLTPLSQELTGRSDVRFQAADVYESLLQETSAPIYDVIMIDVDHSPDDRLAEDGVGQQFYTAAGLRAACGHLRPGGVLAVWSYAASSPFADAMQDVFPAVHVEPVSYHNQLVNESATDWLFFGQLSPGDGNASREVDG